MFNEIEPGAVYEQLVPRLKGRIVTVDCKADWTYGGRELWFVKWDGKRTFIFSDRLRDPKQFERLA